MSLPTLPPPRHLLVRLPNPLGDAVLATPALRALRVALPDCRITWAGGRVALEALEGLTDRDDVLPVAGRMARGPLAPWRAGRMWRRTGCDAVLLLPHAPSAALAARVSGARVRVGSGRGGGGVLLTRRVSLPEEEGRLKPRSMVRMYLDLAAPFGARDDGPLPRVVATAYDGRRAARRLAVLSSAPYFAANPGAAFGSTKIYPPRHLGVVVKRVRDRTGLVPIVLCGPGEESLAAETALAAGPPCHALNAPPPDVGELKALLAGAQLLITTDAGPRHLGEALGTPTVALLGPTDPRWTEESRAAIVRNESVPCLGCHRRTCPIGHPCLDELDPEVVASVALGTLASAGAARRSGAR